jgi:hypothetical protein
MIFIPSFSVKKRNRALIIFLYPLTICSYNRAKSNMSGALRNGCGAENRFGDDPRNLHGLVPAKGVT